MFFVTVTRYYNASHYHLFRLYVQNYKILFTYRQCFVIFFLMSWVDSHYNQLYLPETSSLKKHIIRAVAAVCLTPLAACTIPSLTEHRPSTSAPAPSELPSTAPSTEPTQTVSPSDIPTSEPPSTETPSTDPSTQVSSEIEQRCAEFAGDVAQTEALRQRVASFLTSQLVKKRQSPGAVVVIGCAEQPIAAVSVGSTRYEEKLPPTLETKYDVSSVSKFFTAMGILMLHEKGMLDIDEPVGKHLPEYAKGTKASVTLRDLLQHQAGIVDGRYSEVLDGSTNPNQIEANLLAWPVKKSQKGAYLYSNVGFSVAGIAASRQLGQPLTEAIEELIFKPLGMKNTTYDPKSDCAPTTSDYDSTTYECTLQDRLGRPLQGNSYHTGVFTTGQDTALFMREVARAFMDKSKVISSELIQAMCTPSSTGYGMGARINGITDATGNKINFGKEMSDQTCGHSGWNGTKISYDPTTGLWTGFLANGTYGSHMESRYDTFSALRRTVNNDTARHHKQSIGK